MSQDYPQNTPLMWAADLETELKATNELFLLTYSKSVHTWTHTDGDMGAHKEYCMSTTLLFIVIMLKMHLTCNCTPGQVCNNCEKANFFSVYLLDFSCECTSAGF